jgi:tyrosyl-tRNA synthetase
MPGTVNTGNVNTDAALINEALSRSIAEILPSADEFRQRLLSGDRLRIYVGIDPTASYVHIGHSTNYLILERLHKLGHEIVVLVGDFTAMIGDPSDKTSERVQLTRAEVEENLESFREQIGKILPLDSTENPIEFRFNSEWLSKLDFTDAVDLASNFTVQQMLERETFKKRVADGRPLYVHELFYPFLQGYDSVALEVDAELGGTDQKFNMLAGRTLLRRMKEREKFVITSTLLVNPKTGEKLMSKSLGTGVALNEPPQEMFFKVMRLPDEGIVQTFIDCTRLPLGEVQVVSAALESGDTNPRDLKLRLAAEIVGMYHGPAEATEAEAEWRRQMSDRALPTDIETWQVDSPEVDLIALVRGVGRAASNGEARRLIAGGGVRLNGNKVEGDAITVASGDILQVGKKTTYRLEVAGQASVQAPPLV